MGSVCIVVELQNRVKLGYNVMEGTEYVCVVINECCYNLGV
jgi:hypothetical protein